MNHFLGSYIFEKIEFHISTLSEQVVSVDLSNFAPTNELKEFSVRTRVAEVKKTTHVLSNVCIISSITLGAHPEMAR